VLEEVNWLQDLEEPQWVVYVSPDAVADNRERNRIGPRHERAFS
jgi:hypothetical protein